MRLHVAYSLLLPAMAISGCGIIAAPIAIPHVLASNHDIDAELRFFDEQRKPVEGVTVQAVFEQLHWDAWVVERPREEVVHFRPATTRRLVRRNLWYADLIVTKAGYAETVIRLVPGGTTMPSVMSMEPYATNWEMRHQLTTPETIRNASISPIDITLHRATPPAAPAP